MVSQPGECSRPIIYKLPCIWSLGPAKQSKITQTTPLQLLQNKHLLYVHSKIQSQNMKSYIHISLYISLCLYVFTPKTLEWEKIASVSPFKLIIWAA